MTMLPEGFSSLEPFLPQWGRPDTAARAAARGEASAAEREAFFAAAVAQFEPAMSLLDAAPLVDHSPREQRLLNLMLALSHVSLAIEVQREDEGKHTPQREAMRITRGVGGASG